MPDADGAQLDVALGAQRPLLDPEQVGEVGAEGQLHRAVGRLLAVVATGPCPPACPGRRSGSGRPCSELSAAPGRGWLRRTKVAENGFDVSAASGSGGASLIRSSSPDRNRVSRKNRPWAEAARMSPLRSEMQKDDPSTRVTWPSAWPSDGLAPAKFKGSEMGRTILNRPPEVARPNFHYGRRCNMDSWARRRCSRSRTCTSRSRAPRSSRASTSRSCRARCTP